MVMSFKKNLLRRAAAIGDDNIDNEVRTQKIVLVILSLSAIPLTIIWAYIEFSMGDLKSVAATGIIGAIVLLNFAYYAIKKDYAWFRYSQLTIFLFFPFILHITVGGFEKSANLIWGLATPLIALLSSKPREGTPWFAGYVVMIALLGILEPVMFPQSNLTSDIAFFEFSFNIINGALIVYLVILYFLRQKNRAYELLNEEEKKSERLLINVLPEEIAMDLKAGKQAVAQRFEAVSVLFADIVGFTPLSSELDPEEMVNLLNQIFSDFDALVEKYGLEKIRTIGDSYMVASGVPSPRPDHAQAIAKLALDMRDYIESLPAQYGHKINFRIGINSGPVVAGIVGTQRFHYDIWGDPVNIASRMESHGVPGQIQMTSETRELIKDEFVSQPRGRILIKGKGEMETWFLTGVRAEYQVVNPTNETDGWPNERTASLAGNGVIGDGRERNEVDRNNAPLATPHRPLYKQPLAA